MRREQWREEGGRGRVRARKRQEKKGERKRGKLNILTPPPLTPPYPPLPATYINVVGFL